MKDLSISIQLRCRLIVINNKKINRISFLNTFINIDKFVSVSACVTIKADVHPNEYKKYREIFKIKTTQTIDNSKFLLSLAL